MKRHFAVLGIVVLLLLGGVGMAEEKEAVWSSFGLEDIRAMKRAMKAFFCEGGPASEGKGNADFFVLRGEAVDALSPDLRAALDGREAVCIGQYQSGGAVHRVLYTVDNPPVFLGVFRQEEPGRWAQCTGDIPRPDAQEPESETKKEETAP